MTPSAWLLAAAALTAGLAVDPVLRRVPRVARRLPPGALPWWLLLGSAVFDAAVVGLLASDPGTGAAVVGLAVFTVCGVYLSLLDLRHRLLPNVVVLPAVAIVATLLVAGALVDGAPDAGARALLGGAVLFAGYLLLALVTPGGIGMGDVKLAALVGLVLAHEGWWSLLLGTLTAFILAAVVGLVLMLSGRARRGTRMPFGPAMVAAALLMLLVP